MRLTPTMGVQVCDQGSANGTFYERGRLKPNVWTDIEFRQPITIPESVLVVQRCHPTEECQRCEGSERFQARLRDELMTHARLQQELGVCVIHFAPAARRAVDAIVGLLAPDDIVGDLSQASVAMVLVRRAPRAVDDFASAIETYLVARGARPVVRTTTFPRDGSTVEALFVEEATPKVASSETIRPLGLETHGPDMQVIHAMVARVAPTTTSILICGETGTGKDVLAHAIHQASTRAAHPFIAVNCAALPDNLLESELFGFEKGAFTGAHSAKPGQFELADGGTLFLDEIGDMPFSAQSKLLRVIQERSILRLGGVKERPIDIRLIAATNRDLPALIDGGRFRADLFYRLNGFSFTLPPLRDRVDSIVPMARHFIARAAAVLKKKPPTIPRAVREALKRYLWPGNIRELKSVIERAVLLAANGVLDLTHLPREVVEASAGHASGRAGPTSHKRGALDASAGESSVDSEVPPEGPWSPDVTAIPTPPHSESEPPSAPSRGHVQLTREEVEGALQRCGGNQRAAAKLLKVARGTLIARMEQYGLRRPRKGK